MSNDDDVKRRKLDLPDRRKNTYEALEQRLDAHIDEIGKRLDNEIDGVAEQFAKWLRRGLVAFSIIGLACAIALYGFKLSLNRISDTRKDFTRSNCEATNHRHDTTYASLIAAAQVDQNNAPNAAARLEIRRRRDVTLALIDLISPHQDCDYLVKLSVGKATPTPTPKPLPQVTPTKTP